MSTSNTDTGDIIAVTNTTAEIDTTEAAGDGIGELHEGLVTTAVHFPQNAKVHTTQQVESINKIYLTLLNGTGYVFDVDDYMRLRSQYRIVGSIVGTTCRKGWSGNECTMPVELSSCETRLLIEQGIAVLVSKQKTLVTKPTKDKLEKYKQKFESRIMAQAESMKAEKLRETKRNLGKILAGKRKKLLKSGVPAEDIRLEPNQLYKEIADNFKFDRQNALIEISCAHPQIHTAYMTNLNEDKSLKYRVFCDFWQRGNFVTAGDGFGADFLIYPGDPMLYHASHIVILQETPHIKPLELIAKVRLSVIVNKLCVFAYFDPPNDANADSQPEIHYQTVSWEGNRDKKKLNNDADT